MRILFISGSLPPMKCGVGDYTANLARALARWRNTSVAVLTDGAATSAPSGWEFEVFPIARGWRMLDVFPIVTVVRRWRPDVVHIQYPTQGYGRKFLPWLLPSLFRLLNVPVVQTWHEYHLEEHRRNILNVVLAGGLVTVRPNYQDFMSPWYRWLIRRKEFKFIPNASAIPQLRLSEDEKAVVRLRYAPTSANLVVYFGFAYPAKRVELLFEIADPLKDHLVLICDLSPGDAYHKMILDRINDQHWADKVTVTGFLPPEEVGRLLAAADAVVLPFRDGGGKWNTSIHAATIQGTFVLTTTRERARYDSAGNIYFARCDDMAGMRDSLRTYIGSKGSGNIEVQPSDWESIASAHMSFYPRVIGKLSAR
jgi:glycosyltransferase involved in cell wall biosynthesis